MNETLSVCLCGRLTVDSFVPLRVSIADRACSSILWMNGSTDLAGWLESCLNWLVCLCLSQQRQC